MKNNWHTKKLGENISFNQVVHSWLKAEWYDAYFNELRKSIPVKIIENPDFRNEEENKIRIELLKPFRSPMLDPIPSDTLWYEMVLNKTDLERTFLLPHHSWSSITNNTYQILEAVKNVHNNDERAEKIRKIKQAIGSGKVSKNLILVASSSESAFTVIEGNHRAVAFAIRALEHGEIDIIIDQVFLGISPDMKFYNFHIEKYF